MIPLLLAAGTLCVGVAVVHGWLGETRLIGPASFPNREARQLVSAIWQLSTAIWIACGLVIAASPWLFEARTRSLGIFIACLPLLWGVVANAWITRGRHPGWKALGLAVALALVGAAI